MKNKKEEKKIIWWKDKVLVAGIVLIAAHFLVSFVGLSIFLINISNKIYRITGLSLYGLSWIMFAVGLFLVGEETFRLIKQRIHHHVKKTVKRTYHHARKLHARSYHHAKNLHKRLKW